MKENEKATEFIEEIVQQLLIEWRFLSLSKEKLLKKIENIYNRSEENEVAN